jgi:hypothetical protein
MTYFPSFVRPILTPHVYGEPSFLVEARSHPRTQDLVADDLALGILHRAERVVDHDLVRAAAQDAGSDANRVIAAALARVPFAGGLAVLGERHMREDAHCVGGDTTHAKTRPAMTRIAVSPRAYRAIKASLPEGAVVYPPERDSRGRYLLNRGGGDPPLGHPQAMGIGQRGGHPAREDKFRDRRMIRIAIPPLAIPSCFEGAGGDRPGLLDRKVQVIWTPC